MRLCLVLLITLATASGLFAQHRTFALDQGQSILSASPGGTGGALVDHEFHYDAQYQLESVTVFATDSHNGVFSLGESVSWEYGLYDTVAVGVKSGIPREAWDWGLAGWVTFDGARAWGADSPWGLFWTQGLILDPLVTGDTKQTSGLVTLLSSMLLSGRLFDTEAASLALYTQGGLLISSPNPLIDAAWRDPPSVRKELRASGWNIPSATKVDVAWFRPKLVLEAGVEVRLFRTAGLVVGVSRSFTNLLDLSRWNDPERDYGLGTLEFRWWL